MRAASRRSVRSCDAVTAGSSNASICFFVTLFFIRLVSEKYADRGKVAPHLVQLDVGVEQTGEEPIHVVTFKSSAHGGIIRLRLAATRRPMQPRSGQPR